MLIALLAFFVRSESESVKFRSEAFSVMLAIALLMFVWAIIGRSSTSVTACTTRSTPWPVA